MSLVERASGGSSSLSGPGRAIGIIQSDDNQKIVTGLADIGVARKVAVNTRFRIASLSKPMLSIALSGLENRRRLSLNDPLSKHLPELPHLPPELTLRTLLAHRGGWHEKLELLALAGADHSDPVDKETIQKLLRSQRETNFFPGSG